MARSLRLLAGFCMGGGGRGIFELERNIYITTSDISIFEKWYFVSELGKIKLKF